MASGQGDPHPVVGQFHTGGEPGAGCLVVQVVGDVREQEMVCAVQALGGRSLTFLGYIDPEIGEGEELYAYTDNLSMLAGQLATSIGQYKPAVVFTHGSNGEYGHPAHVVTHMAAKIAIESQGEVSPLLYSVAAIYPEHPKPRLANKDDLADLVILRDEFLRNDCCAPGSDPCLSDCSGDCRVDLTDEVMLARYFMTNNCCP